MTKKIPKVDTIHGKILIDDYFWLRDKDDPDVLRFLEKENDLANAYMNSTDSIQRKIFDEILAKENENYESLPYKSNGYWYQTKRRKGENFPIHSRWKEGENSNKKIFFNENEILKKLKVEEVTRESLSKNNRFLAFSSDKTGSGELDINILDLETNQVLEDLLIKGWEAIWLNDSKTLYYTKDDSITNRTYQLYKHIVGTKQSEDLLIYEEKDEAFSLGIYKSRSESYIFLESYSKDENQIWYLNANKNDNELILLNKLKSKTTNSVDHSSNFFYLLTNDNSPNFKINRAATIKADDVVKWQEFVPENKTIYIQDYLLFENYTVINENKKGLTQFHVYDKIIGDDYYIPVREETYILDFFGANESKSSTLKYTIESFSKPETIYEWDFLTRSYKRLKTMSQGNYIENNYKAELVWTKASDGTEVPISLVYKKELFKKNGTNPLLIEGYGSFGETINPEFETFLFPLLDRGFVYARPHIRGGGFLGEEWYHQGNFFNKKIHLQISLNAQNT